MSPLKIIFPLIFLTFCTACHRQDHSATSSTNLKLIEEKKNKNGAIGKVVNSIDKNIWNIYQDQKGNYWFGSKDKGIFKYDGKTITNFTKEDGLPANRIRGMQEDKEGNIYFDTGLGISRFDGKKFERLLVSNEPTNNWTTTSENLWFEGDWAKNGVYRYDGKYLHHLEFPTHSLEAEAKRMNPGATSIPYDVYKITKDQKGNIWIGTAIFGACQFDGASLFWVSEREMTEIDPGPAVGVRSIIEDQEGYFWFNSNVSHKYKIIANNSLSQEGKWRYEKVKGIDASQFPNWINYFNSMTMDNNGHLWMARYGGEIWKYDGKELNLIPMAQDNLSIISIYKDNNGKLWLGTEDDGVYHFNGKTFVKFLF